MAEEEAPFIRSTPNPGDPRYQAGLIRGTLDSLIK